MKTKKTPPTVNSGSMADIAFLLLIFFLVTTTIASDKGIQRKLPPLCQGDDCIIDIHERNILRITLNGDNQLMVEDDIISIKDLKEKVKTFIDNNGDKSCDYCNGMMDSNSSDNPKKAVISLQNHPQTSYDLFIKVQDELTKAYYELREVYASNNLAKKVANLTQEETKLLKEMYPFIISEAQTK